MLIKQRMADIKGEQEGWREAKGDGGKEGEREEGRKAAREGGREEKTAKYGRVDR